MVLPAPFGPSRPKTSPRWTVTVQCRSAATSPYRLVSPSVAMNAVPIFFPRILGGPAAIGQWACRATARTSGIFAKDVAVRSIFLVVLGRGM